MGLLTVKKSKKKTKKKEIEKYDYLIHEKQFITKEKIEILNLPQTKKVWCGAKESGKTRPVVLRTIGLIEKYADVYGLGIKKYKHNAVERLSQAMLNVVAELKLSGFHLPNYRKTATKLERRFFNNQINFKNQTVEFQSLEDINGLAGIEAPNLGKFEIIHIEEPVEKNDSKIPTKKRFWEDIEVIERSINRSNVRNAQKNNTSVSSPIYHFTLNAWDDHPLITEMEEVFPEDEFLNECLKVQDWKKLDANFINENWENLKNNLIENNTSVRIDAIQDIAWIRLTRFANPNWNQSVDVFNEKRVMTKEKQLENFWNKLKNALLEKNYSYLAIHLGLKNQDQEDNKTYVLENAEVGDVKKIIRDEQWEIIGSSFGWDIDLRREFVLTPCVLARNFQNFKEVWKIFIFHQKDFDAKGDRLGTAIPLYKENLKKFTIEALNETTNLEMFNEPVEFGKHLYIDDDHGVWISEFEDFWNIMNVSKAKKHGNYSIIIRQDLLNILFNRGLIVIDEKNKELLRNLAKSSIKDGTNKRDESSTKERLYDRINSLEYAIYPFRNIIWW